MQAKLFELLAHLQPGHAEPLCGFCQIAVRALDGLRVELRFEVRQHLLEGILSLASLDLIHQFCDIRCMGLL